MKNETKNTIEFVDVEQPPTAILFSYPYGETKRFVVVCPEETSKNIGGIDNDKLKSLFGLGYEYDCIVVTDYHFGYSVDGGKFYRVCSVDCISPPMFVCDADYVGDAVDTFANECEDWVKIEEPDLSDYDQNELSYNENGTPVDLEQVAVQELTLESVRYLTI